MKLPCPRLLRLPCSPWYAAHCVGVRCAGIYEAFAYWLTCPACCHLLLLLLCYLAWLYNEHGAHWAWQQLALVWGPQPASCMRPVLAAPASMCFDPVLPQHPQSHVVQPAPGDAQAATPSMPARAADAPPHGTALGHAEDAGPGPAAGQDLGLPPQGEAFALAVFEEQCAQRPSSWLKLGRAKQRAF